MREIKFKFYIYDKDDILKDVQYATLDSILKDSKIELPDGYYYKVAQYAEREDKNSAEIYEGNILKITELETQLSSQETTIHKVECIGSVFEIYPFLPYGRGRNDLLESTESKNYEVEVIGNIYENPELLSN